MARIMLETFYSLASLNQRIRELMERLNSKVMQKLGCSRASLFIHLDKPELNHYQMLVIAVPRQKSQSPC